jgi:hypothetical protein
VVHVHVISSGPGWLTLPVTFLLGAATTLFVQVYVVPRVETRKRREDRWERNVLELGDLLTTRLARRAEKTYVAQAVFRDMMQLESEPGLDQRKIAQSREQQTRDAQQAMTAYSDLLRTRVNLLIGRIEKIAPEAVR